MPRPDEPIFNFLPPQPIEHIHFIHGWTLDPNNPHWYTNTAEFMGNVFDIEATVPSMPNTNSPHPLEWEARIDEVVKEPASTILVLHSLALINGLRYVANKKLVDPDFQLGGLVSVAGNLSPVGFTEIRPHFLDFGQFTLAALMANLAIHQVKLLYGAHDPFVDFVEHGLFLSEVFGAKIYIDDKEAHFSGEHRDEQAGLYIPPCKFNLGLAFILSKMILNVAPPDRYDKTVKLQLNIDNF